MTTPISPAPLTPPTTLRDYTSARVALKRTGASLTTSDILDFQLAHAQARDAVHATLDSVHLIKRIHSEILTLADVPILTLTSAALDRAIYLRRPDLGRQLDPTSIAQLQSHPPHPSAGLAIVIADGLSATAIDRHAIPLLSKLLPLLTQSGWHLTPISIVTQARVAIADHIGHLLHAALSIVLIGERPGLSSPDSLGAYITWSPTPGRTDAERNCISNIRTQGLDYVTAAHRIAFYCNEARQLRLTGIALKEKTPPALPA